MLTGDYVIEKTIMIVSSRYEIGDSTSIYKSGLDSDKWLHNLGCNSDNFKTVFFVWDLIRMHCQIWWI